MEKTMKDLVVHYGTGNPAKLASMKKALLPIGIQVVGVHETGRAMLDVDENGSTPLENARIKALAYYSVLGNPVFACDSGLYIEELSEEEQPGIHVRTVNDKRLNDDMMIIHYAAIAKRLGGKAKARYKNGICLVLGEGEVYEHFDEDIFGESFYIVSTPHPKRVEGFPLDCLSVHIPSGKYYYDGVRPDGDIGIIDIGFQNFFLRALGKAKNVSLRP